MATLEDVFDGVHLLFLLFFGLIASFRQGWHSLPTEWRRWSDLFSRRNTFGVSATSTFPSLYRSLLLSHFLFGLSLQTVAPSLSRLHFRLNGDFRRRL
jgi:hypothetical protein